SHQEAGGLRPLPGVPRMRWNASLVLGRSDARPALDWQNLTETLRQATALSCAVHPGEPGPASPVDVLGDPAPALDPDPSIAS
ncbi:hypothetical protein GTW71_26040, partial [Streptomyces sp. SID6041]|nr:hypothetical protein [Streptomyces sp. SID6041]